jgi:hypothetical protein
LLQVILFFPRFLYVPFILQVNIGIYVEDNSTGLSVLVDRAVGGSSLNWARKTTCCPCFGLGQIVKAQALVGFSRVGFFILLFLKKIMKTIV